MSATYTPDMNNTAIYLHAWNLVTITNQRILSVIHKTFGSFERAWYEITPWQLAQLSKRIDLIVRKQKIHPEKEWERFQKIQNIRFITHDSAEYPSQLAQLSNYPFGLYIKGNYNAGTAEKRKNLSVVGTRQPSPYGMVQTQKIIQHLRWYPVTIVSGLADGIDSIAHETALLEQLDTWAVIGHGHHALRESKHDLARAIIENNGCIMSEYPPGTPAEKFRFPERNRIIAGLSPVTVVTEAPEKSGANITAKIAREENREVFALCADIDRVDCQGNLQLIESHTATPLTSYQALIHGLHLSQGSEPHGIEQQLPLQHFTNENMNIIMREVSYKSSISPTELIEKTSIKDISEVLQTLSLLEIEGLIESVGGEYRATAP